MLLLLALTACGGRPASEPPDQELRAREYASRARSEFDAGERELGVRLATRALVVRLAHYGVERPEPALSFIQLGDMRRQLGQLDWARQCYVRALQLAAPHERTHPQITQAAAERLASLYRALGDPKTAERLERRFLRQGAAP